MATASKWQHLRLAVGVKCQECGAVPGIRCTTECGDPTASHAVRIARASGLHPTPRRGHFSAARPVEYTDEEVAHLTALGDPRYIKASISWELCVRAYGLGFAVGAANRRDKRSVVEPATHAHWRKGFEDGKAALVDAVEKYRRSLPTKES